MKVVTPQEMAQMDQKTIASGISGIDLMEKAGTECTQVIESTLKEDMLICVICGPGNNGGDGQVIARQLSEKGFSVQVFFTEPADKMSPDSQTNYSRLQETSAVVQFLSHEAGLEGFEASLAGADLVVDAVFGTGLKDRPLGEWYEKLLNAINACGKRIVAIDIPSGLRGDNGLTLEAAVEADQTIIIQNYKVGCLLNDGPDCVGEPVLVDIGIDENCIENNKYFVQKQNLRCPVKRKKNSHKYDYGSVVIIAGSKGMIGAGLLATEGALKSGAGLVTSYVPLEVYLPVAARSPVEVMIKTYDCNITGEDIEHDRKRVVLIGPGIGRKKNYSIILNDLLYNTTVPVVIDADGLFHLSRNLDVLKESKTPVILTPHFGEFSTLTGVDREDILEDPIGYGRRFAEEYQVVLVLKGYRTMICSPEGEVFFNSTSNPGMATAGSGDVLAGMIAGFAGQSVDLLEAAKAGVFYHGAAGDYYAERYGESTLTARNIIDSFKYVLN
ncbi:NAD(P)H-hydrate dehydratase [Eubacterium callanderi]|uniref:NAD(P)H-hydrate dehydratase n=1 Tax=Eubacterium callanderi TaxID=53442 RepID=UPI001C110B68|nr:NAD(P)H-hydrate dehydratase [Eubacterium callanderi]MBU5304872.1 NAD(P)H-hydrate dehydratase [Eubacterium callanderi]